MSRRALTDGQWERIEPLLAGQAGDRGRTGTDNRLFVDAVPWLARTASPWRDLPAELGNWRTVHRRVRRWTPRGVWERLSRALAQTPDFEHVLVDATIRKAHADASGAKGGLEAHAIGRSRGGLTTKVHAAVDALGLPVRFDVTPGHWGDRPQAQDLPAGRRGVRHVIADAGHDPDPLRRLIADELGATAQIKPNPTRSGRPPIDWVLHKERHLVECVFNRIERVRRIALRCDKTLASFRAFVALACAMAWLA